MSGFVRRVFVFRLASAAVLVLALGCGSGDKGYRVTGKVTFNGQPVPVGKIYFNPDGAKGNTGPGGYADIKDGAYDTSAAGGRGFIGGPAVIAVEGFDPSKKGDKEKGDTSGEVTIKALFPRYEVTAELPREATTKDIEVPAEATKRKLETGPKQIIP